MQIQLHFALMVQTWQNRAGQLPRPAQMSTWFSRFPRSGLAAACAAAHSALPHSQTSRCATNGQEASLEEQGAGGASSSAIASVRRTTSRAQYDRSAAARAANLARQTARAAAAAEQQRGELANPAGYRALASQPKDHAPGPPPSERAGSASPHPQVVGALDTLLRRHDPAALLSEGTLSRLANGLAASGLRPSPPLIGSELNPEELLTLSTSCRKCGAPLRPWPQLCTTAVILDVAGAIVKRHMPKRCRHKGCDLEDRLVWHNYMAHDGQHLFYGDLHQHRAFLITSSFGLTTLYLRQLHLRLAREQVSFAGEAFVANALLDEAGLDRHVLVDRLRLYLSEGWFKWRIAIRTEACSKAALPGFSLASLDLRQPTEALLRDRWPSFLEHFEAGTAAAVRSRGEPCDIFALDGHQKNRRSCCAALYEQVVQSTHLGRELRLPCPRTPLLGSCFCSDHAHWADITPATSPGCADDVNIEILDHQAAGKPLVAETSSWLVKIRTTEGDGRAEEAWVDEGAVSPALLSEHFARVGKTALKAATERKMKKPRLDAGRRAFLRKAMEDLGAFWEALTPAEREQTMRLHSQTEDLHAVSCGTHKESEQERVFHAQTAGFLCACLSSGTVVMCREIYGSESLSQRYFFVAELKARYPEANLIVHDDGCHLHKFAETRATASAHAAAIAPPAMLYALDGFHCSGHIDPWCRVTCHPEAPMFKERLTGFRSSVCEFTFTWLAAFKHATKHMSEFGFKFFVLEMIDMHNDFVARGVTEHLPLFRRRQS